MTARKLRRALTLTLLLLLLPAALPQAAAVQFQDVPQDHWAYPDITEMANRGLIQGSGGVFRPDQPVSCQAFLSMVCRASGLDDRQLESGSRWAEPAQAFGQYFGWYRPEEMPDPAAPITRELAAQLLVNAFFPQSLGQGESLEFRDKGEITPDRLPYVLAAAKLGLINGYADGTFRPKEGLTRAAAASLLYRSLLQSTRTPGKSVQVPVLMYHDVSYLGQGYSKTPEIFKKQMQELKNAGFHTVFFSQLIDFVEQGTPLPDKPVVISIDDGYATNYTYVFPILQELDMKAEISVIGNAIQYADWGLKWDQIREMQESGLVSIQAHTKSLHADNTASGGRLGVLKTASESWSSYVKLLAEDTQAELDLIQKETGRRPLVFTYPRGKYNAMAEAVSARLGFKVSLTTKDGVATVTENDASSLRLMNRIGMDFRNGSVTAVLRQFGYLG